MNVQTLGHVTFNVSFVTSVNNKLGTM